MNTRKNEISISGDDIVLSDGQHKHGGDTGCCFFCTKVKTGCQLFSITPHPDLPPECSVLYNQRFVTCPECNAKGTHYLAEHLLRWMDVQKVLNSHGVGLPDIERHKLNGTLPKFKKRKRR